MTRSEMLSRAEIEQRLRFLGFAAPEQALLRDMSQRAATLADQFVDELYDHLFRFEATRALLRSEAVVSRLKRSQRRYFDELFHDVRDPDYVARRLHIGVVHHRVNLAPQFFLGTYCRYIAQIAESLCRDGATTRDIAGLSALLKAVFFDAGLVLQAYFQKLSAHVLAERSAGVSAVLSSPDAIRGLDDRVASRVASEAESEDAPTFCMTMMLDDAELQVRRDFVGLDLDCERSIRAAADALAPALSPMIDAFYERLLAEPELAALVAEPGTVERLRGMQEDHWRQLLAGPYDRAYAASRVVVGRTHERIDLHPHWFLNGVCVQLCELLPAIFAFEPRPAALFSPLVRAVFFDLTFVLDAYMQARLEQLLRAEGYATALVARMPSAVVVGDAQRRIVAANPRALALLGVEGAMLLGSRLDDVLPVAGLSSSLQRVSETGEPIHNLLVELVGSSGDRSLRINVVPLRRTDEMRDWVAVLLDDVSALREHDREMRATTAWLRQVVEDLPGMLWQAAPQTGDIEAIAGRVEPLSGFGAKEWRALPGGIGARLPAMDRSEWQSRLHALREPGDSAAIEHDLIRPSGETVRVRSDVRLALTDQDRPVWRGLSIDITAQAQLRAVLDRQLREQREVSRLAGMAVETSDLRAVYAAACSALHRMLACDGVLLIERGPNSDARIRAVSETGVLDAGDWVPSPFPELGASLAAHGGHPLLDMPELQARDAVRLVMAPIWSPQPNAAILGYWRADAGGNVDDVGKAEVVAGLVSAACQRAHSERQHVQEGRRAALGGMAAGIAHDFNNVLAAQLTNLELLKGELVGHPAAARLVDDLCDGARSGRDLVAQVLSFARPSPASAVIELDEVVAGAVRLARSVVGSRTTIVSRIDSGCALQLERAQVQRAIVNLVDNAAKASDGRGEVVVETVTREIEAPHALGTGELLSGRYGVIRVIDRGRGMPPEEQRRVFEPFFTTRLDAGGTGLGLSIVHSVATAAGGAVDIDSAVGRGTTVELWLPAEARAEQPREARPAPPPSRDGGPVRVLLVEDQALSREAQRSFLESAGYLVTVCKDAETALCFIRRGDPFDLVVTDVGLPNLDGISLTNELKRVRPSLPVVIASGSHVDAHGADAYLVKPFSLSVLLATLESLLARV